MRVARISPLAVYALLAAFAAEMFLGDIDIGPVSPRVYIYLLLLAWMLFRVIVVGDAVRLDRAGATLLALYAAFLVWCGLATLYQGASFKAMAIRFASYDVIAVAGFLMTLFIIRNRSSLRRFILGLTSLVALSSTVAFVQATGLPVSWRLLMRLRPQLAAPVGEPILANGIYGPVLVFPPGLYPTTFTFGYFLAASSVLALALFVERRNVKRFALVALIVASLVVVQQRSAVLAVTLTCAMLIVAQFRRGSRSSVVSATAALAVFGLVSIWFVTHSGVSGLGRLGSFFDPGRVQIAAVAVGYVSSHPFAGGVDGYVEYFVRSADVTTEYEVVAPHNMFLNAAVFYGVPALFLLCLFLTALVLLMGSSWRLARRRNDVLGAAAVLSLFAYLINAQFHNASFVSGDQLPWWLIATMLLSRELHADTDLRAPNRIPSDGGNQGMPELSVD